MQIKIIVYSMFVMIILFLTEYSYSSDFFDLNGKQFEINEMDVGRKIGCLPGYYIGVVIRRTSDQKIIWSSLTTEELKKHYFHDDKCAIATNNFRVEKVFRDDIYDYVDFVITHLQCGASCMPQTATIMRFDGNKVSEVKMIAGGNK